MKVAK